MLERKLSYREGFDLVEFKFRSCGFGRRVGVFGVF